MVSVFMLRESVEIATTYKVETDFVLGRLSQPLLIKVGQYLFPLFTRISIIILVLDFDDELIVLSRHYDFSDIFQQDLSTHR